MAKSPEMPSSGQQEIESQKLKSLEEITVDDIIKVTFEGEYDSNETFKASLKDGREATFMVRGPHDMTELTDDELKVMAISAKDTWRNKGIYTSKGWSSDSKIFE